MRNHHNIPNKSYNVKSFNARGGIFNKYAVSGPTKAAVKIAKNILKNNGSAIDAVIALQVAAGLTEPHASGLGGGGFILYFNKKTGELITYDGRETAPKQATTEYVFCNTSKDELRYREEFSPSYIGIPGILKAMQLAYKDYGNIKWSELFEPTINLAKNGFKLESRIRFFYNKYCKQLPDIERLLTHGKGQETVLSTDKVKNLKLADTLSKLLTEEKSNDFYYGEIAKQISDKIKASGGILTPEDLASYCAKKTGSLYVNYKKYKIHTRADHFVPLVALKLLEKNFSSCDNEGEKIYKIATAVDIAMANKRKYQEEGFLHSEKIIATTESQDFCSHKCAKIHSHAELNLVSEKDSNSDNSTSGTTSFFAIDKEGNIAIVTSSINGYFGAGIAAEGIVLNNTMLDFSASKGCANDISPYKRPTSSMSPIIVLDKNNNPIFGVTSAGGVRIITYVVSTLINMLENGLSPQESINAIKYSVHNNQTIMFESDRLDKKTKDQLAQTGYKIIETNEVISGLVAFKINYDADGTMQNIETGREVRRWGATDGE